MEEEVECQYHLIKLKIITTRILLSPPYFKKSLPLHGSCTMPFLISHRRWSTANIHHDQGPIRVPLRNVDRIIMISWLSFRLCRRRGRSQLRTRHLHICAMRDLYSRKYNTRYTESFGFMGLRGEERGNLTRGFVIYRGVYWSVNDGLWGTFLGKEENFERSNHCQREFTLDVKRYMFTRDAL